MPWSSWTNGSRRCAGRRSLASARRRLRLPGARGGGTPVCRAAVATPKVAPNEAAPGGRPTAKRGPSSRHGRFHPPDEVTLAFGLTAVGVKARPDHVRALGAADRPELVFPSERPAPRERRALPRRTRCLGSAAADRLGHPFEREWFSPPLFSRPGATPSAARRGRAGGPRDGDQFVRHLVFVLEGELDLVTALFLPPGRSPLRSTSRQRPLGERRERADPLDPRSPNSSIPERLAAPVVGKTSNRFRADGELAAFLDPVDAVSYPASAKRLPRARRSPARPRAQRGASPGARRRRHRLGQRASRRRNTRPPASSSSSARARLADEVRRPASSPRAPAKAAGPAAARRWPPRR